MSFSMVPGMTLEQMQRVLGGKRAEAAEAAPAMKRARVRGGQFKADDPVTPEANEAWETES